ncbi:MAG: hypothetical protein ACMG6E_04705 [Candidatus Roizmanbacteria bacterium]
MENNRSIDWDNLQSSFTFEDLPLMNEVAGGIFPHMGKALTERIKEQPDMIIQAVRSHERDSLELTRGDKNKALIATCITHAGLLLDHSFDSAIQLVLKTSNTRAVALGFHEAHKGADELIGRTCFALGIRQWDKDEFDKIFKHENTGPVEEALFLAGLHSQELDGEDLLVKDPSAFLLLDDINVRLFRFLSESGLSDPKKIMLARYRLGGARLITDVYKGIYSIVKQAS